MQRVIQHTGLFATCPSCQRQPKHILQSGKDLHWFECCPCGTRTAKFSSASEAIAAWEAQDTMAQTVAA